MKILALSLLITVILIFCFGCNTENPLCTDNYCVEGEIYPRAWLDTSEDFETISVDDAAILNAIVGTTPAPPTLTATPTLSEVVAHVAAGGRDCIDETYTLTGVVEFNYQSTTSQFITLDTGNDDISFFITDQDKSGSLADYARGETHTFTCTIKSVGRHRADDRKHQSIHSDLVAE